MNLNYHIQSYCRLTIDSFQFNDAIPFQNESKSLKDFLKEIYKKENLDYPKFFKMDMLSQMTLLTSEVLLKNTTEKKETALVFSNRSSSLGTDRKHQSTIISDENFYPSPANFVYTLPNIGMGEVAIKHKLQTENAFFVFEKFNTDFLHSYAKSLLKTNKCNQVLCGWVEVGTDVEEAFVYLVAENGMVPHTKTNIDKLYNNLQ